VQNKKVWPTQTSDGSSTTLCTDLTFIHQAFSTALTYAGANTRLMINDYNTGGADAKTACVLAVLKDINVNANVPFSRLGVGFQSHITASQGQFSAKSALESNFATLAALGATAAITELDIALPSVTTNNQRYQAAIWGDYLDVCPCSDFLISPTNCQ
jgi:endo-1,4-beta-xylanase